MEKKHEKVILVGLGEDYAVQGEFARGNPLDELTQLTLTAGGDVVGTIVQRRTKIEPKYYIGTGKAQELHDAVTALGATTVILDHDLSPAQVSNLQELLGVKVIDRSGLILDIFALRARTREAKTQVELAQLKYLLPRLTRQWTHLSRQVGGIGVRGPGETQLEVDRRRVRDRIAHLNESLKKIEKRMTVTHRRRKTRFMVTLVGYTNAGKSTLFNAMCRAHAPVENLLFKTLDSMTRMMTFEDSSVVVISDTIGFIRNLPHELIASFKSTLADVREAALLLHVIDVASPAWQEQLGTVESVLRDIGASDIRNIMVFNKIDQVSDTAFLNALRSRYPGSFLISARDGTGIVDLKHAIREESHRGLLTMTSRFGPDDSGLISGIYRYGIVHESVGEDNTVRLTFSLPEATARKLGLIKTTEGS